MRKNPEILPADIVAEIFWLVKKVAKQSVGVAELQSIVGERVIGFEVCMEHIPMAL